MLLDRCNCVLPALVEAATPVWAVAALIFEATDERFSPAEISIIAVPSLPCTEMVVAVEADVVA